jgi:hypothetical protein
MMDPLEYLSPYVNDSVAPQAHSVMACPLAGKGVFNGSDNKQTFAFSSQRIEKELTAWGKVGFALWADDYMQGVYNHYGIRETILQVDGKEVFRSNVHRIPVYSNRQVNSWGDYQHWLHHKTWYMRSYIPKGVTLPILQADENDGYVLFNEERPYRVTYILRDFMGNESQYEFTVLGKKSEISPSKRTSWNVRYDRLSMISLPGMQLVIPAGMVEEGLMVVPKVDQGSVSNRYTFAQQACPLFGWAELSLAIPEGVDSSLLYIDSGGHDMGGVCQDGWITTRIRELGATYELKLKNNKE